LGLRTIGVRLTAEVSDIRRGIAQVRGDVRGLTGEFDRAAKTGHLDKVADQARNMGLGLVAAFAAVQASAARFEKAMSQVDAATHASAAQMDKLSAAAVKAGRDTAFSATEAAQGEEELAKAGVSVADILGGGLKGALDLAAAGQMRVADAAETAASAMAMFKLSGSDVGHVADLLAAAAGKAQGEVSDMAMALKQGGLVAAQTGLSIEETVGTLAAFAHAGLLGSDAGTSFKTMLLRLAAPTEVAADKMRELGISAFDSQGKFIGMAKFAGVLQNALKDMSQEERLTALNVIFGTDAIRAAALTYEQGQDGIAGWIEKVDETGYASDTARRKTDNLIGDVERLGGSLDSLAIESGSGANQGLRALVQMADALAQQLSEADPILSGTIVMLTGLSGAALLAFAAWTKLKTTGDQALAQLSAMGPAGERAAKGLSTVAHWAGRAALAFAALEVAGAIINQFQSDLNPQLGALSKGLQEWARSGQLAGESARVLGADMKDLDVGLKFLADTDNSRRQWARGLQEQLEAIVPGLDGTNTSLTKTRERVTAIDSALSSLVQGGHADTARAIFNRLAASQAQYGVTTEELIKLFPEYAGAIEEATAAGNKLNRIHEQAAINAAVLSGGLQGLVDKTGSLKGAWDSLHATMFGFANAEIAAEAAVDKLSDALTENGNTLDINTAKGRENKTALLEGIQAAAEAAQKKYEETGSVSTATQTYSLYIGKLREAMIAAGMNKTQVEQLLTLLGKMPPLVATTVTTPGIDTAISKLRTLQNMARDARLDYATRNRWGGVYEAQRWGGVTEHAADGLLRQAQVYSAVSSGARYAFAEPATGGELFVPKHGDKQRSLSLLNQGARWYGHTIMPTSWMGAGVGAGMGGGTQTVVHEHRHTVVIQGREMLNGFRREVDLAGGKTDHLLGRNRA
jgi:TP901 family phage tail tape measure protein